jgi:hypothetical protein
MRGAIATVSKPPTSGWTQYKISRPAFRQRAFFSCSIAARKIALIRVW